MDDKWLISKFILERWDGWLKITKSHSNNREK